MTVTKTYFMVHVVDMDRAAAFYREGVGLDVRFVSPDWSELAWRDATVALHGGATSTEQRVTGLGFEVDDLDAACKQVAAAGGTIVTAPRDRPGEPIRLADVADTEGNVFSLAESV
jgi:predicted enzyme related to lactoylglutathione lyase